MRIFPSTLYLWMPLTLLSVVGACYSLTAWSSFPIKISHIYQYLFDFDPLSMEQQIIASIRMPRVLAGLLIGANLAVAGLMMQGLTRNPLASPSILGINAGAACLMALASIGVPFLDTIPSVLVAAVGGVVSGAVVLTLGGFFSAKPHPLKLVLAGIAINALLVGVTRAAVILADDKAYSIISWLAGSLSSVEWQQWNTLWPTSVLGLIVSLFVARQLNLLALGSDVATSLGINIRLTRALTYLAVVLLTASSVAVAGAIGFVGMLVPHIAKRFVGNDFITLIPASALLGAALIVWADALSRAISFPAETPVGVITALIGTPCFVFLAMRSKSS
ncbi:iron chelate uptake ABC transporter family permease subunit [Vibrio natriegens]|uniref:FecCD family ABC transporter permease n=1 Tax=Vibrio natriegens TaxID=691 RepID=UPI0021E6DAFF|nr:iron chelate uptake ABC transporter family permease subunit [Vibrio natriegens]UYI46230.1 iron chelate uptake ABC transporter family permease subunit [Vibrio natriegens]